MNVLYKWLTIGIMLVVAAVAGKAALDAYANWRYGDQVIDALNAAATADSTRQVFEDSVSGLRVYQRRAFIATEAHSLAEKELIEERELRERQGFELRAITETAARLTAQIEGITTGTQDGREFRIEIDGDDGPINIQGEVVVAGTVSPENPPVRYSFRTDARLRLRSRILRDPETGAIFTEVTSPDPQVTIESIETTVDKSVGDWGRKGFFSITAGGLATGFVAGGVVGVVVCALVCP